MKHIKVAIHQPVIISSSNHSSTTSGTKATITSPEGWQITTECRDEQGQDLEQAKITIYLPNNKVFTCSIQDLMALPAILNNAHHVVLQHVRKDFDDKKEEERVLDSGLELQAFMKLFS